MVFHQLGPAMPILDYLSILGLQGFIEGLLALHNLLRRVEESVAHSLVITLGPSKFSSYNFFHQDHYTACAAFLIQ